MLKFSARKDVISKSQYVKGLQCHKALWLHRHRKNLATPFSKETQHHLAVGQNIGELAKQYFKERNPQTAEVQTMFWDVESGARQTRSFLAAGEEIIFEATAAAVQTYSRIDVLQRTPDGQMAMIEVKSATKVKPYHLEDMAFQYYVFCSAGHPISACYMMLLDTSYVRQGQLQLDKLFQFCDITKAVLARQDKVQQTSAKFSQMLIVKNEPQVPMGRHCREPFSCEYIQYCQSLCQIPEGELFATNCGLNPQNINATNSPKRYQIRPDLLQKWLEQLQYPLYFLDYECFQSAVPLFDKCRPYQMIPFQFSLHIQREVSGKLQHFSFLHMDNDDDDVRQKLSQKLPQKLPMDPRQDFIQTLLQNCGRDGSIIIYNRAFEAAVNKTLGRDFPSHKKELLALNDRMQDLHRPFQKYWLYSPQQKGSSSLKAVLPAFTAHSYQELAIGNGFDAMNAYLSFLHGVTTKNQQLRRDLEQYCRLDTQAMSLLLEVIQRELKRHKLQIFPVAT